MEFLYFLREKTITLSIGVVFIKEFTLYQNIFYSSSQNFITQFSILVPNLTQEQLVNLTKEDVKLITSAKEEVNKIIDLPIQSKEEIVSVSLEECLEFLCERWKKDPIELSQKYSLNQIVWWNYLSGERERKLYELSKKETNNRPTMEDLDKIINQQKQSKNYQSIINKYSLNA